ncbi:MAG TPA: 16S rRNA (uracil(1498)-N(3))-methyltransferase [Acholeplasmataceae bacterium]|nr:16S rRNA (uracil(1498)-N(3))-methyltransferase [Acholeplasmataceae bacterium]
MQRYFLDDNNQIQQEDAHHILNVMRFKSSTEVELCGKEGCFLASLEIQGKHVSYVKISPLKSNLPLNITIIQGLPKGDKVDMVTRYATLFQAKGIIFVPMKRSIAKLSNVEHKLKRLNKIAKEASELSKRSQLPVIDFKDHLDRINFENKYVILLDELETKRTIKDSLNHANEQEIYVIIGPEGGIDATERIDLMHKGATPMSLGPTILPTELAHIPILNAFLLKKL